VPEGGFGLDPVKVVAGADEHLAGDLGSNPGKGKKGGGGLVHQLMKLLVGFGDLLRELLMATGQSAQRGLGGVFGVAELVSWAESGAGRNQLEGGQVPQLLANGAPSGHWQAGLYLLCPRRHPQDCRA
jgi:hypothetical protein